MLPSVVRILDNTTGPRRIAPLVSPARFDRVSNRKSGIRNPNNLRVSNHFHFSNRKYSAISRALFPEPASHSPLVTSHFPSNRDTAIKNPNKLRHFNHFQFPNRDKMRLLHPERRLSGTAVPSCPCLCASLLPCLLASLPLCFFSPCLRASVANLCDNGWL